MVFGAVKYHLSSQRNGMNLKCWIPFADHQNLVVETIGLLIDPCLFLQILQTSPNQVVGSSSPQILACNKGLQYHRIVFLPHKCIVIYFITVTFVVFVVFFLIL